MYTESEPITIANNKFKTYLIGSMESPGKKDAGEGWRKNITPHLNSRGIYCFDPTKEETQKVGMPTKELIEKLNGWQSAGHWDIFTEYMRKIWKGVSFVEEEDNSEPRMIHVMGDVDYVENSDFLIFHLNDGDKLGGTIAELTIAWYRGIPVYLLTDVPKSKINKSILYFILDSGHGQGDIFKTQTDLLRFLDNKYETEGTFWGEKNE
jgi:hypothetical protein